MGWSKNIKQNSRIFASCAVIGLNLHWLEVSGDDIQVKLMALDSQTLKKCFVKARVIEERLKKPAYVKRPNRPQDGYGHSKQVRDSRPKFKLGTNIKTKLSPRPKWLIIGIRAFIIIVAKSESCGTNVRPYKYSWSWKTRRKVNKRRVIRRMRPSKVMTFLIMPWLESPF